MKLSRLFFTVLILFFSIACQTEETKKGKLSLWYDKPAEAWNEALPVGNGRLGAMVFGSPAKEKIQLNEDTFWSGSPSRNDNPDALKVLSEVRKLIFEGKYQEAEKLVNQNMLTQKHGSMYQTIGNLNLEFPGHENYSEYYRELNLEKALFTSTYKVEGTTFKREVFSSFPDQVIVIRLSSDKKGKLNFTAGLDSPLMKESKAIDDNTLEMNGISSTHEGIVGQVKFNTIAKIIRKGGSSYAEKGLIKVKNANEVLIFVSIATNFIDYKTLTGNESVKSNKYLTQAQRKSFTRLLDRHQVLYKKYFNRVKLDLGTSASSQQPTDKRIKNFSSNFDPELISMYFQFGRYLLISSSVPGSQPANLQGIWNPTTHPAWDSKYTININTEMNYWPAEKCNLQEMHEPLIQMIRELSESGMQTARDMYGCKGWVAHHNTDIWRISGVVDGAYWGMWPMGGAWLSQHLWERYLYNGDIEYLRSVYPIMKSSCEFYKGFLIEEPSNGWLVTCPSISPENSPAGRPSVCAGPTMDNQLLFDLFTKTIQAAKILGTDKELASEFQKLIDKLPPMQIGQYGQLQEWMEDLDNPEDQHRHVSHLYGLHPSNQISPYSTPELFNAARTTLIQRGDVSTGWSMGWKVNFWARLLDGNHAYKLIKDQLTLVDPIKHGYNGGTYPNFFDAHPPFQIDGNFGCTAGIAEMLMQSHDGTIHVLPALPDDWKNGSISGLRAYGGFELSLGWENGQLIKLDIKSNLGGNCRIRTHNEMKLANGNLLQDASGINTNPFFQTPLVKDPVISEKSGLNEVKIKNSYVYDLKTEKGKTYSIIKR